MVSLLLTVLALVQAAVPASALMQPHCHSFRACQRPFYLVPPASASNSDDDVITTSPERPIVVFGAGGKTGQIIARILAEQKKYVRVVTRSGRAALENVLKRVPGQYVSYAEGVDVTCYDNVLNTLQKGAPAGVVWAATSSGVKKGGGDALEVDYKGAYWTAKACLACNVPKLAFISAGCVSRPNSLGSKTVNFLTQWTYGDCPWVDAKMAGETAVRDLYRSFRNTNNKENHMAYVIIRPAAALSNKPPIPVNELLVMQGDVYSSAESVSRTNVAHVVVSALLKGKATDFVTFEVAPAVKLYKNDEGNILDILGLPTPKQTTIPDLPGPLVHSAMAYSELLDGLVNDDDMRKQYGSIVNDYRGEGVPSVEDFA